MERQKRLIVGGRVPGQMVLDAIRKAVASGGCKRRWVATINQNFEVEIGCFCTKKGKLDELETNVLIKIVEPVNPKYMYANILAELKVTGPVGFLSGTKFLSDFEIIADEFTKCFDGYPWPYRVFNNQK